MKKCPPGVICIENITGFFLIITVFVVIFLYIMYSNYRPQKIQVNNNLSEKTIVKENTRESGGFGFGYGLGYNGLNVRPNYGYTNLPGDVLLNPYVPPLSDERYLSPSYNFIPPGTIPINIPTNIGAVETNYRQIGILTPLNSKGKILPLMGRPIYVNRNKWQYYTMSDQNNSIKLPVSRNGRSCTNEYGCDKLFNGDSVYVEGYNEAFKATIYDNDTMRYLPFI
jgi:hypothetical protein